jgi:hypothetical protein
MAASVCDVTGELLSSKGFCMYKVDAHLVRDLDVDHPTRTLRNKILRPFHFVMSAWGSCETIQGIMHEAIPVHRCYVYGNT